MDPFVSQLAELCRAHVTRNKWVFVQSHAIGRTLGERIALEGTNWANLRFVTPLDIAVRMAGPFLVEKGINPSEDGLGPALIMRLLLGLPDEHIYFKPLAEQPSMAHALWSTIRELRMAGIHAKDIADKPQAFESPEKHAELVALVEVYEAHLRENKLADIPAVYEFASQSESRFTYCPIANGDLWTEHPDAIWAPLQRRLLDSLPREAERVAPRRIRCAGLPEPRRWSMLRREIGSAPPGAATDSERLAFLMRPADAPAPQGDRTLAMFRAGSREAEIDEIFRRTLAGRLALDRVEIACASDDYAVLAWEKALRLDWPVTIATGVPGPFTRPGRALLAWCDWIEGDFAAVDLRHLLQSGSVSPNFGIELSPGKAARLVARAEATWGRETYSLALTRLRDDYVRKSRRQERGDELREAAAENAAACQAVQQWVEQLLDAVPAPSPDATITLGKLVTAAEAFVATCSARTSAVDNLSRDRLGEAVAELHALDDFACTLGQGIGFIRERVAALSVAPDRARPGALHLSTLPQTGHPGRPNLFIVGLEEGRVFPSRAEDPVLLDAEREAISDRLRTSNDRVDELQHQIVTRLASAVGHVTLSYACRDTREYRETLPSWVLLQAARLASGDPALNFDGLLKWLGEPVSCVPADMSKAVTEAGWWLAGLNRAAEPGRAAALDHFKALARGLDAHRARANELSFTEFDGHAPAAGLMLDPSRSDVLVSATVLEDAAKCPYRFFLERGLGIEPVPDAERDRDAWLPPLARGSELHDLYAALMRRCRAEKRRPDPEKDRWIVEQSKARLEELRKEIPPPSPEVFERERREFLRDVELFVAFEADWRDGVPVGLEVSFGRRPRNGDDHEPLARAEPIQIKIGKGRTLRLSGRIDRIDQVGASLYDIIDYKSGGYWRDAWKGTFAKGTRLQHALYGLAAAELLRGIDRKAKIRQGVYFFTSARGGQERKEIPRPADAKTLAVLTDLLDVIASGVFVHTRDAGNCTFCDFQAACGNHAVAHANAKLEAGADPSLAPFLRLESHE